MHLVNSLRFCIDILVYSSYRPLPTDGNANDLRFLSSARLRHFWTVFSRSLVALSAFQVGPQQWITNLAGKLWPWQMAAGCTCKDNTEKKALKHKDLSRWTYFPLLIEGTASVLKCFESARVNIFFTAFSSCCCAFEDDQVGLCTWITYLAGKFCPWQIATEVVYCN